jgi:hypothetical protein
MMNHYSKEDRAEVEFETSEIRSILEDLGYKLEDVGKEWRTSASYRGGKNKTAIRISKENGYWIDFAENKRGRLSDLVLLTDSDYYQKNIDLFLGGSKNSDSRVRAHSSNDVEKLTYDRFYGKDLLKKLVNNQDYWKNRGISKETLELFHGGVCKTGIMAGRYVFPIFDEKFRIRGFSGRSTYPNPKIKWKHLGEKSRWEYPLFLSRPEIEKSGYVIVVESIGDMLALWDAGVKQVIVSFGIPDMRKGILYKLIELDAKYVIISLNNDEVGGKLHGHGNKGAANFAKNIIKTGLFESNQIKVKLPNANDFGDMTKEGIKIWEQNLKRKLNI